MTEAKLNMLLDNGILEIKDIPEGVIIDEMKLRQYHAEKHDEIYIEKGKYKRRIR